MVVVLAVMGMMMMAGNIYRSYCVLGTKPLSTSSEPQQQPSAWCYHDPNLTTEETQPGEMNCLKSHVQQVAEAGPTFSVYILINGNWMLHVVGAYCLQ